MMTATRKTEIERIIREDEIEGKERERERERE
jgi:hypothetical protein